ncbi:MAG: DsbA family protein [Chloroflexi bacterium]|nr:DsbA family protein [Chloroflexota bacterium]
MDQSKRQARLERRRAQQRQGQMKWLIYISLAAVVVVGLLIVSNQVLTGSVREYGSTQNGTVLGNLDAPVTLVEYVDFQCSFCRSSWATTEESIIEQYVNTSQIKYEYVIVAFLGPESVQAAEAGYCAADQNKFWEYHDIVFGNFSSQNSGGYSEADLTRFAEAVGLDMTSFNQCLASDEKLALIEQAESDAGALGIDGTPAFVINGQVLTGAQPLATLQAQIEAALAASGAN